LRTARPRCPADRANRQYVLQGNTRDAAAWFRRRSPGLRPPDSRAFPLLAARAAWPGRHGPAGPCLLLSCLRHFRPGL